MAEIDYTLLNQKAAGLRENDARLSPTSGISLAPSGRPPDSPDMSERLAKLEGAFDGFKTVLTIFAGVLVLSVTISIAGLVYLSNRIDRVETKVAAVSDQITALPDKVSGSLRDLTNTLSQAITAARQPPPQVILMPSSQPAQPGSK